MDHADVRYLESKRTVDERARSRRVRDALFAELPDRPDIVEVGAGTGALVPALLDWGIVPARYRGIDRSAAMVEAARERVPAGLSGGYGIERNTDGFVVETADGERFPVTFETGDALAPETGDPLDPGTAGADLVIAQAVLDLVPVDDALSAFERALAPGGLAYLPITFDGVTFFRPAHPRDEAVADAYHAHIDAQPGRDSRAGRSLLDHCRERDGDLLAVGASDWIVRPHEGAYPADEAHFLECILGFVAEALAARGVDADDWLATRRDQLADGRLSYVAHGFDFLYRAPAP